MTTPFAEPIYVTSPLLPPLEAVIVTDPAPTAVTTPVGLTVAICPLLVDHDTAWPDRVFP